MSMLKIFRNASACRTAFATRFQPSTFAVRSFADKRVENVAQSAGEAKETNPKNPSAFASTGTIGKHFNPDGSIGQVGEKIGGPFSSKKGGAIGSQFDASKDGLAGQVEKAVDGPRNPATEPKSKL